MKFRLTATNEVSGVAKQVERDLGTLGDRARAAISSITSFSGRGLMAAGGPIGLAVGAAGGMIGAMTKQLIDQADAIGRLAQLSGAGAEEFQRYAAGAQQVGIEQDKLADILKDTQDKVGEFLQTGGGPLKDFFEKIAPRIGATAEQFRNLSGPQALELYVASLDKAGLSQAEMTFYMEAIASDATALTPLLQDNARGMKEVGDEASRMGAIISDETVEAAQQFKTDMASLGREFDAFRIGALSPLIGALASLAKEFRAARTEGMGFFESLALAGSADSAIPDLIAFEEKRLKDLRAQREKGSRDFYGRPVDTTLLDHQIAEAEARIEQYRRLEERLARIAEQPAVSPGGVALPQGTNKDKKTRKTPEWETREQNMRALIDRAIAADTTRQLDDAAREAEKLDRVAAQWRNVIDPVQKYREQLEEIRSLVESGHLTPTQAMAAEFEVQNQIQDEINKGIAESQAELTGMQAFAEQAARNIQDALGDGMFDLLDGNFKSIGQSFGVMIKRMTAEAMAADLGKLLLGSFGGKDAAGNTVTAVGGLFGDGLKWFSGLFGGARASGGPVWPGQAFLVGEQGPELFVPDSAGTIVPSGAAAGGAVAYVTVNFHGTPNRGEAMRLAQEIEASTLAALRDAQARNDYAVLG